MVTLLRIVLAPVILVCIAVSAVFAFEFGWAKGTTVVACWAFACAGAGLDVIKASMPLFAAHAAQNRDRPRSAGCWFAFAVLTVLSLWCAWGITATQLAERIGMRAQIATDQQTKRATLDRLMSDRAKLPAFEPATEDSITAARQAVSAADAVSAQECKTGIGDNCRKRQIDAAVRRTELSKAITDKTTTDQVKDLEKQIAAADAALGRVDVQALARDVDPQSSAISKAFGLAAEQAAFVGQAIFAIGIEIGSGIGLWIVFGNGAGSARPGGATCGSSGEAPEPKLAPCPPARPLLEVQSADFGSRARFFKEAVLPNFGNRVSSAIVYRGYQAWCSRIGVEPMSRQAFGREAPWAKNKIGGTVYYLNCMMAQGGTMEPRPLLRLIS